MFGNLPKVGQHRAREEVPIASHRQLVIVVKFHRRVVEAPAVPSHQRGVVGHLVLGALRTHSESIIIETT